jgi:ssDNA-binding Zn-finger/Zn-ribbon topoisomerase 1
MNTPICPKCKAKMVARKGKSGDFYGCSNFPSCKFTSKSRYIGGYEHPKEFRDGQIISGNFNTHKG